jgi:hypothetical protein
MNAPPIEKPAVVAETSSRELLTLLLREHRIHEGHFVLSAKFTISLGHMAIGPEAPAAPGFAATVQGVALAVVPPNTPFAEDAAVLNPRPRRREARRKVEPDLPT